jgi:glutamate racemase
MSKRTNPIGIFDSGIGGLTVARALAQALPNEEMIYVGDTAHLPYGEKSADAILAYSEQIAEFLYQAGAKILIIACNTASSIAYESLKKRWAGKMLVTDVISPLVADISKRGFRKVGVIATKATVRSDIYARKLQERDPKLEVASLATSLLANMIEEGFFNNEISQSVIRNYLSYPDFEDIDALLLACTHYPLIRAEIQAYFGEKVLVFDSIQTVVEDVKLLLETHQLLHPNVQSIPKYRFLVSDYTQAFEQTTRIFYQQPIVLERMRWEEDCLVRV